MEFNIFERLKLRSLGIQRKDKDSKGRTRFVNQETGERLVYSHEQTKLIKRAMREYPENMYLIKALAQNEMSIGKVNAFSNMLDERGNAPHYIIRYSKDNHETNMIEQLERARHLDEKDNLKKTSFFDLYKYACSDENPYTEQSRDPLSVMLLIDASQDQNIPGWSMTCLMNRDLNARQQEILISGLKKGLDVSAVADPRLSPYKMEKMVRLLSYGKEISPLTYPFYDNNQFDMIAIGIKNGVDANRYASPEYTSQQMTTLLSALEYNQTHSNKISEDRLNIIFNPKMDEGKMDQLYQAFQSDFTDEQIGILNNPKLELGQIHELRKAMEQNLDYKLLNNPELDHEQMKELRKAMIAGIDVKEMAKPEFSAKEMKTTFSNMLINQMDAQQKTKENKNKVQGIKM